MSDADQEIQALKDALTGDVAPLRQFGVSIMDVAWWRRRLQRYLMPSRYRLYVQKRILEDNQ